jgi:nitrite reductase (NADH) large subunit
LGAYAPQVSLKFPSGCFSVLNGLHLDRVRNNHFQPTKPTLRQTGRTVTVMSVLVQKTLVVVGNGMVGHRFLELAAAQQLAASWRVVAFAEEPRLAYDRVHLSEYASGRPADELALATLDDYRAAGIEVHVGDPVSNLNVAGRRVRSAAGQEIGYDKLVLATGSAPFVPPIPGADREHCFVYRTIEDIDAIRAYAARCRRGVVIGGGLLGLEAAGALRAFGLETHVVEMADRLMALQVDRPGGQVLQRWIEDLGVVVHTAKQTAQIRSDGLAFADGTTLDADMVVFSAGIRPRDELARAAGLAVAPRGGAVINDCCQTSAPDVYAIGECASWRGCCFGLVGPGYRMAEVAIHQLTGAANTVFEGADLSTRLKLMGVDVASFGDAHGAAAGSKSYSFTDEVRGVYKKLVVDQTGRRLLGGMLVGDAQDYPVLIQLMHGGTDLPEHPEALLVPANSGTLAALGGPESMAETAQICQCNNVSKGAVCRAIRDGAATVTQVKAQCGAGTGCGGCVPLVESVLRTELAALGVEVNTDLCEHFPFTRQELFDLVRVRRIHDFDTLLARCGRGYGCEVCKPAVASILAACWNEHILDPRHTGLQDTNDRFLANLQRDGTYSVVPRVPGGEITPDKLITIGTVAKKYGLYTKITGGQRIDLFGAQLHELPLIWGDLIAAGFESGHAYGKALRTVKTCVGSTWCRYGVQDSVGLGIRLEHRYKGLRAPHKIKMAVSGCTRECAEAQSKDVGVIATEAGYNLYVAGNGGMKPRHADLFATDLDEVTLVQYIDRFLMFYIRTADHLQRTARWIERIEGGLDYVRRVVIDDALGIGAELERDMADLVGSYRCEWAAALSDPQTRRRFVTFVNSDAPDPELSYVVERGQRRPAALAVVGS